MEQDADKMVVAMPVAAQHPLAPGQRRKLPGHAQTGRLVASHAIRGEETFPHHHGIGRAFDHRATAGPGHLHRIENIRLEPAAVKGQVSPGPENQRHEGRDQPQRDRFIAVARIVFLAQDRPVHIAHVEPLPLKFGLQLVGAGLVRVVDHCGGSGASGSG